MQEIPTGQGLRPSATAVKAKEERVHDSQGELQSLATGLDRGDTICFRCRRPVPYPPNKHGILVIIPV